MHRTRLQKPTQQLCHAAMSYIRIGSAYEIPV
jgi:hypothetical protein